MLKIEVNASIRKETKKGAMRQMRLQGFTPAVVYGGGTEAIPLKVETTPFWNQLLDVYRKNAIVSLNLDDGSTKHVLIQDVQTDPVKDFLLHADFIEIDVQKPRVFEVPISYKGTAPGVELGGMLNVILDTLAIEAAPLEVPDDFVVDISKMTMNDSVQVSSIDIPGNCTLVTDPEMSCVSIVAIQQDEDLEEEVEEDDDAGEDAVSDEEGAGEEEE
ncbi:MAG: 50S ribosomal protein L25 [Desulfopila sp.]